METKVLVESPIVVLESDYCDFRGGRGEEIHLYARDFKEAMVGKIWTADYVGSCGRGNSCESLEVVYKNKKGGLPLFIGVGEQPTRTIPKIGKKSLNCGGLSYHNTLKALFY